MVYFHLPVKLYKDDHHLHTYSINLFDKFYDYAKKWPAWYLQRYKILYWCV